MGQVPKEACARLLIVGDDPFGDGRKRVEAWAQEQGLLQDGRCVLTGIRRDVSELLAASDVFIMPAVGRDWAWFF